MEKFVVTGGVPLNGEVRIAGAKNAVLKLIAAAALTDEPCRLRNVPTISDVANMVEVLADIGFEVRDAGDHELEITARAANWLFVPLEAAQKMRASFIVLGPMLARFGKVIIPNPGGDRIGRRPVNLHVAALEALGATIAYKNGYYFAAAPPGGLRGGRIEFPVVTVMGTENALMAATLARGTTIIDNAALEPEVDDLIAMLRSMGAQIERRAETPRRLEVQGVDHLHGAAHDVLGDRLEAGTFAIAAAVTGGSVTMTGVEPAHMGAFLDVLDRMGVAHEPLPNGLHVAATDRYEAVDLETQPYPGLATDFQAPLAVLLTQADGDSTIHETIYEDRLDYTRELCRMGAVIEVIDDRHARVSGPSSLRAAEVSIPDLRAGATLVLAALAAEGTSTIGGVEHVDRGYEAFEAKLVGLGARISRTPA